MAFRHIILLFTLLMTACSQPGKTGSVQSEVPDAVPVTATLDSFQFNWRSISVQDVIAKIGASDQDVGSGIYILEYRLQDGSKMWIGSSNYSDILYVRHGTSLGKSEIVYGR